MGRVVTVALLVASDWAVLVLTARIFAFTMADPLASVT
jgi:hypothetical protein